MGGPLVWPKVAGPPCAHGKRAKLHARGDGISIADAAVVLEDWSVRDLVEAVAQREIAHLVERAGGLERLASAEAFEIAAHLEDRDVDVRDRGAAVATPSKRALTSARAVAAAFELGRRVEDARAAPRTKLASVDAIVEWAKPRLAALPVEEAWVLAVDAACNLRAARCIARGGHAGVALRAADPVRAAIRLDASAFFLVHNHPSGDPTPSWEDEQVTARIAAVATIADIPLLEHIVIARQGHALVTWSRAA